MKHADLLSSDLEAVLSRLELEFATCPPPALRSVFAECVECLDPGSAQALPELVYRLAGHRLRESHVPL